MYPARVEPVTSDDVDQALHHLHPNKDDWSIYERSNMERALHLFLVAVAKRKGKPTK